LIPLFLASLPLLAAAFPLTDLSTDAQWSRVRWIPFVSGFKPEDAALNLLITIPLGIVAAAVVPRNPLRTALVTAVAISSLCELAQIFAPSRFPSGTDVFCNALGAATGVAVARMGTVAWAAFGRQQSKTPD
jgi:glycopeptide antibiotics resistance protein